MTKQRGTTEVIARRGRPVMHNEPYQKITVVMLERHAGYLDVMSVLIRMRHRKSVSRAELIRAFIEFMERSGIDFTAFADVDAMTAYLVNYFRRIPNRGRLPLLLESSLFQPARAGSEQQRNTRGREIEVVANT